MRDANSIIIAPAKRSNFRIIRSKHEIFSKGKIIWEVKEDCLYIRLPDFDEDNATSVNSLGNNWYKCTIECDIPFGIYEFEDDSTIDVKIIYFGNI